MRVLFVASECYPLIKTGGLADVVGALPPALRGLGVDVRLLLPGFPAVLDGLVDKRPAYTIEDPWTGSARLVFGHTPDGTPAYAIEAPTLYGRGGNPYLAPDGKDWPDNGVRFALLGWAAAWLAGEAGGWRWRPDVVHGHDWQAGLAPAYLALRGGPRPATVTTIHNIAYQGLFPPSQLGMLRLPPESYGMGGVEFYGHIGFLKAGLYYADRITTVSPTYAREIQTPDGGWGLDGLLTSRAADLRGILNGVDYTIWNPETDPALPERYDAGRLDAKAANKAALQAEFGLDPEPDVPLFTVVTRLTVQKGFDLLLAAIPHLLWLGGQLAVLGSGEAWLEEGFRRAAAAHPGRIGVRIGYDEALSHRIQGGGDSILLPSRSEPCGLIQMYGLRYGTLPMVRRTGGLADTVVHADAAALAEGRATGFVFDDSDVEALKWAMDRAVELYHRPEQWRQVQRTAMAQDFGWTRSARQYLDLYRSAYADV